MPTLRPGACLLGLLLVASAAAPARAVQLPCAPAEPGTIALDGLVEDWREVEAAVAGDERSGVSFKCNVEGKTLYLVIEASDERVVRTKLARPGEDHLELSIGDKLLTIFPAAGTQKAQLKPGLGRIASSASDRGFVVEVALPFSKLGLLRSPERLAFSLRFFDCDSAVALTTEHTVKVEGELAFTAGPSTLDAFLEEHRLSRSSVRWQRQVKDGGHAVELVLAGRYLAALGDGYAYVELPVADGKDVHDPELVDLAGDGRQALLLRYTERGGEGSREVLAVFRAAGPQLKRVFAAEIGKRTASGKLSAKVTLKRRGKATDLLFEAQPAEGLTEASYAEAPATDLIPILLPWSAESRATFSFSGTDYQRK